MMMERNYKQPGKRWIIWKLDQATICSAHSNATVVPSFESKEDPL
jgi:hypothetical protein